MANNGIPKQLFVPGGIIVKERKMLMQKRRDPRADYDGLWEFAGGGVEYGEEVIDCLKREIKEETGYEIRPVESLPIIKTCIHPIALEGYDTGDYQIFLMLYICEIIGGEFKLEEGEAYEAGWFTLAQLEKMPLMPLNKDCIHDPENFKVIKKYID